MKKQKRGKEKISKKKENFFIRNFKESLAYIKESRNYIYFIIGVFLLFGLIGFFLPIFFVDQVIVAIQEIMETVSSLDTIQLIIYIFFNNLKASIFGILFGLFLGIIPFFITIVNGYLLGFVSNNVVQEVGFIELWRILPHGIFELPAVFISLGLGLKFGMFLFSKNPGKEFIRRFLNALKVTLLIIIPLLLVAAVIEGILIGVLS